MGKTKGPYKEEFPKGTKVKVADRSFLEDFHRTWRLHHKLEPEQLGFADRIATVKSVGFYHGGDELYELDGVPGIWHEACLRTMGDRVQAPEDYAVFSCVLNHENYTGEGVDQVVAISDPMPLPQVFVRDLENVVMPGLPQTMLDELRKACREVLSIENKFHAKKPVTLVSNADVEQIFRPKDKLGWVRFRERFPRSSGITTLSRVVFDEEHSQALVYVGNQKDWLSGAGIIFSLSLTDGAWNIQQSRTVWLS